MVDACSSRIHALHDAMSTLLLSICRYHGSDTAVPGKYGMAPMTLFRCIDMALRIYNCFSRKKVYALYLYRAAVESGKGKDVEACAKVPCS